MDKIASWAHVAEDGTITQVGRPASLTFPDDGGPTGEGGSMGVPLDLPLDEEWIARFRECGYYPVTGENPDHDPDTGRLVHDGFELQDDRAVALYHVDPHPEPEPAPVLPPEEPPDWVTGLRKRDDQIEALFTEFRERFDRGLATVEAAAEYVSTLDVDDKLGQLDRILARAKEALSGK